MISSELGTGLTSASSRLSRTARSSSTASLAALAVLVLPRTNNAWYPLSCVSNVSCQPSGSRGERPGSRHIWRKSKNHDDKPVKARRDCARVSSRRDGRAPRPYPDALHNGPGVPWALPRPDEAPRRRGLGAGVSCCTTTRGVTSTRGEGMGAGRLRRTFSLGDRLVVDLFSPRGGISPLRAYGQRQACVCRERPSASGRVFTVSLAKNTYGRLGLRAAARSGGASTCASVFGPRLASKPRYSTRAPRRRRAPQARSP